MNEKIADELLKYMNDSKDFLIQECPEVFSQIISYERSLCIFCLCIFLPLFLMCLGVFIYYWKNPEYESWGSLTLRTLFPMFICGGLSFISFIFCFEAFTGLMKINTAPKYFIIQKIMNFKK